MAPSGEETEDCLPVGVKKLTMSSLKNSPSFDMAFRFTYLLYTYIADKCMHCSIDFLVINVSKRFFATSIKNNKLFELVCKIPWAFMDMERLMVENGNDYEFTEKTHKATAF